jgi:GR25 family glycosyltransferase involved in LPS biosynthesis
MPIEIAKIPTYILNIPNRIARRKNALLQVKKLGIKKPVVYPAITPQDLKIPYEELEKPLHKINRFTPGCFAYNASFLSILEYAIAFNKPYYLYIEDDIFILEDAKEKLQQILNELPQDWDVLLLSAYHYAKPDIVSSNIVKVNGTWGTNAVMINHTGYKRLFALISQGFRGADLTIGMSNWLGSDLNVYATRHNIGYETPNIKSDIINKVETKELPIDVMTHTPMCPIEIQLAQNSTLNLEEIWNQMKALNMWE